MRKITLILLSAVLIPALLSQVYAAGGTVRFDDSKVTSLTVEFSSNDTAIPKAKIEIWKVGVFNNSAVLELKGVYAGAFSLNGVKGHENWDALAAAMRDYVDGNGIDPLHSKTTDNNGRADFGTLTRGLYLVVCRDTEYNGSIYRSLPFLVTLPNYVDEGGGNWIYNVTAKPKPGVSGPVQTTDTDTETTAQPPPPDTGVAHQSGIFLIILLIGFIGITMAGVDIVLKIFNKKQKSGKQNYN